MANQAALLTNTAPGERRQPGYFRMSGTSMAAPMVAGAVALLLQGEPNLNPDQVKYRLKATAVHDARWPGYDRARAGAGYLDAYAAAHTATNQTANTGLASSHLLWTGGSAAGLEQRQLGLGELGLGELGLGQLGFRQLGQRLLGQRFLGALAGPGAGRPGFGRPARRAPRPGELPNRIV